MYIRRNKIINHLIIKQYIYFQMLNILTLFKDVLKYKYIFLKQEFFYEVCYYHEVN